MSKILYQWSIISVGNYVKIFSHLDNNTIYLVPKNTLIQSKISNNILQLNTLGENIVLNIDYNDVISPPGSTSVDNLMTLLAPIIYESGGTGTSYIQNIIEGANISIDYTDPLNPIINGINQSPIVVVNYSDLPAADTVSNSFYWCSESEGDEWTPGTFYNSGLYYSNGISWEFSKVPYQASQTEINEGINDNKFVTPKTLKNSDQWNTKVNISDLPSNLILYPTNVNSPITGYFKMVTDINDPDYNSPSVNINTGIITGSNHLISSLASNAGILLGNPGIVNLSTIGNIRRISGSGEAHFYFELYHRNNIGTETLLATSSNTPEISNATFEQFFASALLNNGTWISTDLIIIKYYASKVGAGTNPTYEFQFGGTEPVRTILPVPASNLYFIKETFETISKNLKGNPYVINYTPENEIIDIVYTLNTGTITKTINYTGDKVSSIVLSGDISSGIYLTKNFYYTGDNLTSVNYS